VVISIPLRYTSARTLIHPRTATGTIVAASHPVNRYGLGVLETEAAALTVHE